MTAAPDHGADTTPAHISRVRGQIGDAAASTSDLLDLLTAGLAEDDRHPGDQTTRAAHDNNRRGHQLGHDNVPDGGGPR